MFKYSFNFFKILFVQISDIGQHVDVFDTRRPPLAVFQNGMINQTYKVKVFLVLLGHFFMTQLWYIMSPFSSISRKKWFFILAKYILVTFYALFILLISYSVQLLTLVPNFMAKWFFFIFSLFYSGNFHEFSYPIIFGHESGLAELATLI